VRAMSKHRLKTDPITANDLDDYIKSTSSDFAFELTVLRLLHEMGCRKVSHGGTYDDPATAIPRQHDLRAELVPESAATARIRLAVECKNLRPYYPLLVYCVPRRPTECSHDICRAFHLDKNHPYPVRCQTVGGWYELGQPVGKSCAQVGRTQDGKITGSDGETFDKWSQAVASAFDLIREAFNDCAEDLGEPVRSVVIPVLVVPDNQLWKVEFDADGCKKAGPDRTNQISYFVNKTYEVERTGVAYRGANPIHPHFTYTISHLEMYTLTGLREFATRLREDYWVWDSLLRRKEV